jgi:hypothetical protein
MSNTIKLIILLVTLVVIGSSFGTGYILGFNSPYHQVYDQVIIDQAWNEIFTEYINRDAIDTRTLSHAAIEGMIKALDDPYSAFLEPE